MARIKSDAAPDAYKKLEIWSTQGRQGDYHQVRLEAFMEVGPSVFFSLLLIAAAFIPVFTLVDQEGRLFKPLAWTKNLTILMAAILAPGPCPPPSPGSASPRPRASSRSRTES